MNLPRLTADVGTIGSQSQAHANGISLLKHQLA